MNKFSTKYIDHDPKFYLFVIVAIILNNYDLLQNHQILIINIVFKSPFGIFTIIRDLFTNFIRSYMFERTFSQIFNEIFYSIFK